MFHRDPILIRAPLGRIYSFTRYYRGDDFFDGPRLAFPHDRGYARERLLALTRHLGDDPFNYRLLDVWQLVFQKPWTRPASLHQLVIDLTDKITRGELFVYLEPNLERDYRALISDGPSAGAANPDDSVPLADIPRVAGPLAAKSPGWASDYASGLGGTVSAMASDFASEQADLYDNSSGWGNVMYPVFKPIENAGRLVGNTVGLLSGLSPKGMNPDVAEYWSNMGEGFQALGSRIADAVGGDGRAAGEVTPALASAIVGKKLPDGVLKQFGRSVEDLSKATSQPFKNTDLTKAARALDKHAAGQRSSGTFPPLTGNNVARNQQAQEIVDRILNNSESEFKLLGRGGLEVRSTNGQGMRFNKDGSFSGFVD